MQKKRSSNSFAYFIFLWIFLSRTLCVFETIRLLVYHQWFDCVKVRMSPECFYSQLIYGQRNFFGTSSDVGCFFSTFHLSFFSLEILFTFSDFFLSLLVNVSTYLFLKTIYYVLYKTVQIMTQHLAVVKKSRKKPMVDKHN